MKKNNYILLALLPFLFFPFSCYEETAIPVEASFVAEFIEGDQSAPVQIQITNHSQGAEAYQWTFEGATPATSTDKNPGTIAYEEAGTYTITLLATNTDGEESSYAQQITVYDQINLDFSVEVADSNYPPAEAAITNHTAGVGLTYEWTFTGGNPSSSTEQHPNNIVYENPGDYQITLAVSNGFESFEQTQIITVLPDIEAAFDWSVNFEDEDYQAPVTLTLNNQSISATSYQWTFPGGAPSASTEENPTVTFNAPGTYTLTLVADNGKHTATSEQEITIYPDTNLKTFTNVKFGINPAHNNNAIGAFFSTTTGESYTSNQVNALNGAGIDVVFSGLNYLFSFNKFIAPDTASSNGFMVIPDATHTKFINSQEICGCGGLTDTQFDTMTDDTLLQPIVITETPAGLQAFNHVMLPRIVLFQTADGRKGAIKIKGFISDGNNSYIDTDIKVQKQP